MTKKLTMTKAELRAAIHNLGMDTQFDVDWISGNIWNAIEKIVIEREIEEEANKIRAGMNC